MYSKERERVIETVLDAYSFEECLQAETKLVAWLDAHPDDIGMYDLVSTLATIKQAAIEEKSIPGKLVAASSSA